MKKYEPCFTGAVEGYVTNFLRKNFWRVSHSMEYEDIKQEAALVFVQVRNAYPDVETPQHFMSLFKTSWFNHFTDLSNKDSALRTIVPECNCETEDNEPVTLEMVGDTDNQGMLHLMITQAPADIKQVLSLFIHAPVELLELATMSWRSNGKYRSEGNAMVSKLLGIPESEDVLGKVHRYFAH